MKRARVYRRGPRLFFHAVSQTSSDLWVVAPPFVKVEHGAAETFLGETLVRALVASRSGARDLGPAARKPLLALSRSKSWTVFMRGTLVCDVEKDGDGVRFFPARNATRRPFVAGQDDTPAVVLPARTLSIQLGAAILEAFDVVTPRRRTSPGTPASTLGKISTSKPSAPRPRDSREA